MTFSSAIKRPLKRCSCWFESKRRIIMFKNYFLIALRNLKKQKAFSLINIVGMAVGMAGFILFALLAGVKLNADKFHENADRIYSVVRLFLHV
jgi:putative ABC transport system permease protein